MKRVLLFLFSVALAASLCACESKAKTYSAVQLDGEVKQFADAAAPAVRTVAFNGETYEAEYAYSNFFEPEGRQHDCYVREGSVSFDVDHDTGELLGIFLPRDLTWQSALVVYSEEDYGKLVRRVASQFINVDEYEMTGPVTERFGAYTYRFNRWIGELCTTEYLRVNIFLSDGQPQMVISSMLNRFSTEDLNAHRAEIDELAAAADDVLQEAADAVFADGFHVRFKALTLTPDGDYGVYYEIVQGSGEDAGDEAPPENRDDYLCFVVRADQ